MRGPASPAGIITEADIARAIADGKDVNDVRVYAVMITRPAVTATASLRDAAKIMTARHLRHLPVAGDARPPRSDRHHRRVPGADQRRREMTRARWQIRTRQHGQASALTTAILPQRRRRAWPPPRADVITRHLPA